MKNGTGGLHPTALRTDFARQTRKHWGNPSKSKRSERQWDDSDLVYECLSNYDENGWADPRKKPGELKTIQSIERVLLGKAYTKKGTKDGCAPGFTLLTPQFGG